MKKVKKDFKPFLVDNSVLVFERGKIALNEKDKVLKRQLNAYKIEKIGNNNRPIFSSTDEHSVDTLNLCLLIFQMEYDSLFKVIVKGASRVLKLNDKVNEEWSDRVFEKTGTSDEFEFLEIRNPNATRKPVSRNRAFKNKFSRGSW